MTEQKIRTKKEWDIAVTEWLKKEGWIATYLTTKNEMRFVRNNHLKQLDVIYCISFKDAEIEYLYVTSDTILGLPKELSIKSDNFLLNDTNTLHTGLLWVQLNIQVIKKHWKHG